MKYIIILFIGFLTIVVAESLVREYLEILRYRAWTDRLEVMEYVCPPNYTEYPNRRLVVDGKTITCPD